MLPHHEIDIAQIDEHAEPLARDEHRIAAGQRIDKQQQTAADLQWKDVAPGMPIMASDVWKGPGSSTVTLMPKGATSFAKDSDIPSIANLAAE